MAELRQRAAACLRECNVDTKLQCVRRLTVDQPKLGINPDTHLSANTETLMAGWPENPPRVPGSRVPKRGFASRQGRAALMHAIAHIEFNAINLALDAISRFAAMPKNYYTDWLQVAAEETYHFDLVRAHLRHLGADYGDFPAHSGLWDMCERTADDVLHRMALVPRVLEARGLDVTPGIRKKLIAAGDANAANILDIILRDEIGHVAIGSRWFCHLCKQRGCEPEATFLELLKRYFPKGLFGPFNLDARRQAGFSTTEIQWITKDSPEKHSP